MKRCAICGGKGQHDPACSKGHNRQRTFTLDQIMSALSEAFDSPRPGVGPRSTRDTRLEAEFRRILSARTDMREVSPGSKPPLVKHGGNRSHQP